MPPPRVKYRDRLGAGPGSWVVPALLVARSKARRPLPLREQQPSSSITGWLLRTNLDSPRVESDRLVTSAIDQEQERGQEGVGVQTMGGSSSLAMLGP